MESNLINVFNIALKLSLQRIKKCKYFSILNTPSNINKYSYN